MITQYDVAQAMRAARPGTPDSEIEALYQRMDEALSNRQSEIAWTIRRQWVQHHGQEPDGLSWGQILDRARWTAEEEIRAEYLGEFNQTILENELEDEDNTSPHFQAVSTANGWRERPFDIQTSSETEELVKDLWPEESAMFWMYAEALLERMRFSGQTIPLDSEHPDFVPTTARIQAAITANPRSNDPI
jgi:hypothetical protein